MPSDGGSGPGNGLGNSDGGMGHGGAGGPGGTSSGGGGGGANFGGQGGYGGIGIGNPGSYGGETPGDFGADIGGYDSAGGEPGNPFGGWDAFSKNVAHFGRKGVMGMVMGGIPGMLGVASPLANYAAKKAGMSMLGEENVEATRESAAQAAEDAQTGGTTPGLGESFVSDSNGLSSADGVLSDTEAGKYYSDWNHPYLKDKNRPA